MKKTKEKNTGKFPNERKKRMLKQEREKSINTCNDDAFEEDFYGCETDYENLHQQKMNEEPVEIDEEYAGLR